jgi:hypothetical protein
MATLRDLGLQAFDTAPASVRRALSLDRWLVLVGADGKPASALPPGTTLEDGAALPAVIVAPADLGQGTAYSLPAFAEAADVAALVLVEAGDGREVAGVVSGPGLVRAMRRGAVKGGSGPVLPGPPAVPWISRSCGYTEGGTTCSTAITFPARPAVMPSCGNLLGLAEHQFAW